jgi:hypothetical protein
VASERRLVANVVAGDRSHRSRGTSAVLQARRALIGRTRGQPKRMTATISSRAKIADAPKATDSQSMPRVSLARVSGTAGVAGATGVVMGRDVRRGPCRSSTDRTSSCGPGSGVAHHVAYVVRLEDMSSTRVTAWKRSDDSRRLLIVAAPC